ncbi:MAG: hypothetical protein QGI63_10690 [Rhodospirillales bacterium]|nr:hypothetical protein [Rhodospirillales bacterium]MDP6774729.1 hypothetical protein [Rhodospirillales bacterium]
MRSCEYTNYCEGLDQKHKMVTCKLWDRHGLDETGVRLTPDNKRRALAPQWSYSGARIDADGAEPSYTGPVASSRKPQANE